MFKPGLTISLGLSLVLLAPASRALAQAEVFAFEQTRIDVGRVPDAEPVKRGFRFTNVSSRVQKIVVGHCHFCPPPECDKKQLNPGESAVVVLELTTMGQYDQAEATADISAAGNRDSTVHIALAAKVCPAVRIEPTQAYAGEVPQNEGTHVTAKVVGRKKDFRITAVECKSPFLAASLGEPLKVQDLDEECTAYEIHYTVKPGAPLGDFTHLSSIITNDPRREKVSFSVEGTIVGDLFARPDHVSIAEIRPGKPFTATFEVVTRSGVPLPWGALSLEAKPINGVTSCVLDAVTTGEPGVVRVTLTAVAPDRAQPPFDFPVLITTTTPGEVVTVPIRLTIRDLRVH